MKRSSSLQQLIVAWAAPYLVVAAPTLTLCPRPALAQGESRAEPTTSEPLKIHVALSSPALDAERVRREVAGELRREVVLASGDEATLTITESAANAASPSRAQRVGATLQFRYVTREGRVLTRAMDLPRDPKKALQMIALLSGNLARDQTSDLIGALHDQRTAALSPSAAVEAEPARTDATPAPPEPAANDSQAPPPSAHEQGGNKQHEGARRDEGSTAKSGAAAHEESKPAQSKPTAPRSYAPLNLSLWHPLSLNPNSHEQGYRFELGLAYSRIGALGGAAFSAGVLRVDGPVAGAAFSSLWLSSAGPLRGLIASGIFVQNHGDSEGAQFSGVVAHHAEGEFTGAQFAGAVSLAGDLVGIQASGAYSQSQRLRGAQFAGAATHTKEASHGIVGAGAVTWTHSLKGAAFAGALSVSEDVDGLVAAGAATVARDVQGLAVAGGVNVQRDVSGVALATVNVQRRVRGLQIGVVNVAERVDGAAIGLINLAGNGRVSALGWVDQDAAYGGVRFISGMSYTELAFGHEFDSKRYVTDAGLGVHVPLGQRITLSVGGAFSETRTRWDEDQDHAEAIGRGSVGLRLTPMVELFAGAGLRYGVLGDTKEEFRPEGRLGVAIF
ncbi:MAG TPA: hypothetical protein VFQ61_20490 [Polyangiaceae bacterium]|nr:hypothetical protein [Polyangiaceae bacterium]